MTYAVAGKASHQRDFLRFWFGESVSWIGSQITTLALPLVAISVAGASTGAVGLLVAASSIATIVVTPLIGPWLDARPVLPVIIATNVLRGLILAAIPLTFAFTTPPMPLLYVVALSAGVCTAVFDIAVLTYVPRLVHPKFLVDANSKVSATTSLAEMAGPALGGLLIRLFSAPLAILADVFSYAVSTVFLLSIKSREQVPAKPPTPVPYIRRAWQGIRHCFANPRLRLLLVASTWFNLCEQTILTAFLVYAVRTLSMSAAVVGALFTAAGCGVVIGSLIATAAGRRLGVERVLGAAAVMSAMALTVSPVPTGPAAPFTLGGAFVVYGLGVGVFNVHAVSFRQAATPVELLGRMSAGFRLFTFGAVPVGAVTAGVLGELLGLRTTIAGAAITLTVGMVAFAAYASLRLPGWGIATQ
ncbi:MFS transporter [Kribbella sp. NPDC055071]